MTASIADINRLAELDGQVKELECRLATAKRDAREQFEAMNARLKTAYEERDEACRRLIQSRSMCKTLEREKRSRDARGGEA
jgi:hypothetical protein